VLDTMYFSAPCVGYDRPWSDLAVAGFLENVRPFDVPQ
jgi:hypothetical protein